MRILLVLPAADNVRVTRENPRVPRRRMLRFSVLPLTTVAALTPPRHEVRLVDENVEPLDLEADVDLVGVSFMTALAPRAYAIAIEAAVASGQDACALIRQMTSAFDAASLPLETLREWRRRAARGHDERCR